MMHSSIWLYRTGAAPWLIKRVSEMLFVYNNEKRRYHADLVMGNLILSVLLYGQ